MTELEMQIIQAMREASEENLARAMDYLCQIETTKTHAAHPQKADQGEMERKGKHVSNNEKDRKLGKFTAIVKEMGEQDLRWAAATVAAELFKKRNDLMEENQKLKRELEKKTQELDVYQVKVLFYYKNSVEGKMADILFVGAKSKTEAEQMAVKHLEGKGHGVLAVTSIRQIEVLNKQEK